MSLYKHSSAAFLVILSLITFDALAVHDITEVDSVDNARAQEKSHPYQMGLICNDTGIGIRCHNSTVVPANQRLIIEYVSASCLIDNSRQVLRSVHVFTDANGIGISHRLNIIDRVGARGDAGFLINQVDVGQMVRLYADPGSTIQVSADTNEATSFSGYPYCFFSLSGQAIDIH
jgi:hypothetical protein